MFVDRIDVVFVPRESQLQFGFQEMMDRQVEEALTSFGFVFVSSGNCLGRQVHQLLVPFTPEFRLFFRRLREVIDVIPQRPQLQSRDLQDEPFRRIFLRRGNLEFAIVFVRNRFFGRLTNG